MMQTAQPVVFTPFQRARRMVFSLSASFMVFLMGCDVGRMPWGDPIFWFTGYFLGAAGLAHFAWRPDLWKFRWIVILLSSIVTLRTIVHGLYRTEVFISALSYNGFFVLLLVTVYIQMRMLGRVPERWSK